MFFLLQITHLPSQTPQVFKAIEHIYTPVALPTVALPTEPVAQKTLPVRAAKRRASNDITDNQQIKESKGKQNNSIFMVFFIDYSLQWDIL